MTNDQIHATLRRLRFSAGLSDEDSLKLAAISHLTEFAAGETIFVEGEPSPELYLIKTGRIELCMNVPPKGCLPILTLEEGDFLGWSGILVQGAMTVTATAIKDTQVVALDANDLKRLCQDDHDIGYEIMHRIAIALSRRLVATRLQVLDLFGDETTTGKPDRGSA